MTIKQETARPRIAVVGVSALFPGSVDSTGFWSDILAGTDRITDVPPTHWLIDDYFDEDMAAPDKTYGRRGGFLTSVELDAIGLGIPPSSLQSTDTAQLLALIVAQQVLEDATRGQFSDLDRSRVSVILGVTSGQELLGAMASRMNRPLWLQGMRRAGIPEDVAQAACDQILDLHPEWTESTFPGLLGNVVAGRIANRLDLGGTNCVTDAACASSFSAISMGVNELYLGDSDMVIAGGVDTMNDILMYMCFSKTPALSKSEDIRPFSDEADGTMLGEGIGMVALKRLDDAERDGNEIYCVINGVGSSSDGRSKSVYAPVSAGQARALEAAYAKSGYGADTVELVEAHGTGTVAGDAAEFSGLEMVFGSSGRQDHQWCALGSVKSQIGHTKAAAGAAGLIKVIMALHHKVLPQTAKIDRPNPKLDLESSPFYLNTRSRPWVRGSDHERRGSVSSFGFGGSNFHLALSEYVGAGSRAPRLRTNDVELVVLAGGSSHDVVSMAIRHVEDAAHAGYLTWLAQSSQRSYEAGAQCRLAVIATDEGDLRAKLTSAVELIEKDPSANFSTPTGIYFGVGQPEGDLAFIFPGQGSQYPFMGADLAMTFGEAMAPWDEAADLRWDAKSLHEVVFPIPSFEDDEKAIQQALLTETQWAQPAIGAASASLLRVLGSVGLRPTHVGGHSFGEITALHAAGVLSEADMIKVARRRGELMVEAAQNPGSMTAVAGTVEDVSALVDRSGLEVVIANHNSPNQVVLSGRTSEIEKIEAELKEQRITFKRLPVATAFHSSVVSGASGAFTGFLDTVTFNSASVQVLANETAAPYPTDDVSAVRSQLGRQLSHPVRFVEMVETMYEQGVRTFVEVGPSSVLTGFIGQIFKGRDHLAVAMDNKSKAGLAPFFGGLAQLVAAGFELDLNALWSEFADLQSPLEKASPKLAIPINGANYGRTYPPRDLSELVGPNPMSTDSAAAQATQVAPIPQAGIPQAASLQPTAVHNPSAATQESPLQPPSSSSVSADRSIAPASASASASASAPPSASVLAAFQATQQQTAEAHAAYLNSMAQVHNSFLNAVQQSMEVLGRLVGTGATSGQSQAYAPVPMVVPAQAVAPSQILAPAPASQPAPWTPPAPTSAPGVVQTPVDAPVPAAAPSTPLAPVVGPATTASPGLSFGSLTKLLLNVVADKTGYPAEMLSMEMELESDLGIDSIKRVEILSAMQEEVPELPEVDTSVMAELVTLGQIVEYLQEQLKSHGAVPSPELESDPDVSPIAHGAPGTTVASNAGLSFESLTKLLLNVVADKTGYPAEMLSMEMELESDLGIDSIKRVEILSAMQEEVPELPEVDTSVMAELVTLGQIVEYLQGQLTGPDGADQALSATASHAADTDGPDTHGPDTHGPDTHGPDTHGTATDGRDTHGPDSSASLERFVLQAVEAKATGTEMPGLRDGRLAVVDEEDGIGAELVTILVDQGVDAELVETVATDGFTAVVFLGGLRKVAHIDEAIAVNREAFATAKAVAGSASVFVTVTDLGGSFGCDGIDEIQAWTSGITALARTAAIEWPQASVKAIDVERGTRRATEVARAIADELLQGGSELEVGLHEDGTRVTLVSTPVAVEKGPVPIGSDDVVVVSGGARGVTAATMIELARSSSASFVLLGRTELEDEPDICSGASDDATLKRVFLDAANAAGEKVSPAELGARVRGVLANREIRQTIASIEAAGAQARYLPVDITDEGAVAGALAGVRQEMGPIAALVHGAGVLADKLISEKTEEQFDSVFDTKVAGLRALLAATAEDPLKVLCLFSSVAARAGNKGQADYAMANEILNKVAVAEHGRRGAGCVVKSLGWGPWAGGMVGPALKAHFEAMGVAVIPLEEGARMLVDEMASPQTDQIELVLGGAVTLGESNPTAVG